MCSACYHGDLARSKESYFHDTENSHNSQANNCHGPGCIIIDLCCYLALHCNCDGFSSS